MRLDVATFPNPQPDKLQMVKILEESAEVYGAWEAWHAQPWSIGKRAHLLDECADVLTATCNLLAALEVDEGELRDMLADCRRRNEERGRM